VTPLLSRLRALLGGARGPRELPRPFEDVLAGFRAVLEDNTRALQVITAMGETLGGDYLFDSTYVHRAYADLAAAMQQSLRDFGALTRGRYGALPAVFLRIDALIRDVIDERQGPRVPAVLPLGEITWEAARQVGGKGAALAELRNRLRLNVPDGFALTTAAFALYAGENGLAEPISRLEDPARQGGLVAEVRAGMLAGRMPAALTAGIERALEALRRDGYRAVAVRSSAPDEDGEFSFAGQFETVLNVPLEAGAVAAAYRRVLASLYAPKAAAYLHQLGFDLRAQQMAACCLGMVDAAASGVLYTADPRGDRDAMIISSSWGLGAAVVEGETDADRFVVRRGTPTPTVETRLGGKTFELVGREGGRLERVPTPPDRRQAPSLTLEQVAELCRGGRAMEEGLHRPLDIEWAIDREGRIVWLQARPLRLETVGEAPPAPAAGAAPAGPVLLGGRGTVVQKGVGAGRVFLLRAPEEIDAVPRGAVLVSRTDSSQLVRAMPVVSAIITDTGSPTSHMASLCREFRIPTVVDTGDASRVLAHGDPVTLEATDAGATVYAGLREDLLAGGAAEAGRMERVYEFRTKRYLLRYIVPLRLIDPLRDDFTPEGCRSLHDILRFVHEKSVMALVERAQEGQALPPRERAVRLELPVPADIVLIDIGGALDPPGLAGKASLAQVVSVPLRALLAGMTHPGAWQTGAVPLQVGDFLTSMLRMPDITAQGAGDLCPNLAVASREYLNLSLRFGYHFTVLDTFCSEEARFNHVYFRFFGGATDMSKRSRRVQFIAAVLGGHGFTIQTSGDLITARLAGLGRPQLETVLDQVGLLLAFTRQLDARLPDDAALARVTREFLDGSYLTGA
jgi:pyruvate,water dikinase